MKLRRKNDDDPTQIVDEPTPATDYGSTLPRGIRMLVRKELRKLPEILMPGEQVIALAQGEYSDKNGLVVATDRRILFIEEGMVRSRQEDFPYSRISSVQSEKGMVNGKLVIYASGNSAVIEKVYPKEVAKEVGDYVRTRIGIGSAPEPTAAAPANDAMDRLRQLQEMHGAGLVSAEEFEAKRAEILSAL